MKNRKLVPAFLAMILLSSCAHILKIEKYTLDNPPSIGTIAEVGPIHLGGFSGLVRLNNDNQYVTITDRGPSGPLIDFKGDGRRTRPFLLPSYRPQIVFIKIENNKIKIEKQISVLTTGLPNVDMIDETPSTAKGTPLFHNPLGIDSEGIVIDRIGNFWVAEEYGPSLIKVDPNGQMLKRFLPKSAPFKRTGSKNLTEALNKRRMDRGFEGIARIDERLYLALQSPISSESKLVPIVEFDLKTETQIGLYLYQLDKDSSSIGDLTSNQNGEIFVLEQNEKIGNDSYRKIYSVKIDSNLNVINSTGIDSFAGPFFKKNLEYDLNNKILNAEEKIEGMAWIDNNSVAIVSDNGFGLGMLFNEETGKIGKMKNNPTNLYIIKK